MNVLSVNVGMPRLVEYNGEPLATGIFKTPVEGAIKVHELNLEGDAQADLRVHGGRMKAVYVYPSEHYEFWRAELPGLELNYGVFGENLTIEGILGAMFVQAIRLRSAPRGSQLPCRDILALSSASGSHTWKRKQVSSNLDQPI